MAFATDEGWPWRIRILVIAAGALLCAPPRESAAQATRPGPTAATRPALLDADERQVAQLIRQMGSERWKAREAASKKLAAMGPKIIPILQKYRNHPDLEIATRVAALIARFAWITRGALVIKILPGSQADRLGVQVGDVFVRVDDMDVTSYVNLRNVNYEKDRTYVTWRAGKLLEVRAGPGLIGCYCISWDQATGGNDHARGVVALAARRYDEAYRRLLAAYRAGTDDSWTAMKLWGLADYALDHKQALAIHRRFLARFPTFACSWSHADIDRANYGLPMSAIHTQHLLGRMKNEKFSADLYHRLDSYFTGLGRNLPLARQTTARAWPESPDTSAHHLLWHRNCRMALGLHDRKWKDVAAQCKAESGDLWTAAMGLRAAVELGDVAAAYRAGLKLAEHYERERPPATRPDLKAPSRLYQLSQVLYAVAAALADGQDARARELLERVSQIGPGLLNEAFARPAAQVCRHAAVAPKMAALSRRLVGTGPDGPGAPTPVGGGWRHLFAAYLTSLAAKPGLTADEWDRAFRRFGPGAGNPRGMRWLHAKVLLRLGRFDEARPIVRDPSLADCPELRRALRLLAANRARLGKDWVALRGVAEVYDARRKGAHWAVRYDGRTFHVGADGKVREVPGLAPGQMHHGDHHDEIRSFPAGTVYFRRSRVYLLDEKARRWVPAFSTPFVGWGTDWRTAATPAVLRYLLKLRGHDPAVGVELEAIRHVAGPGEWWVHQFSDELTLAADARTHKVLDLPLEIARKAPRKGRAAVYRVRKLNDRRLLIPTDAGLWALDADGEIARVKLPLKDQNVMVSVMSWPKREHKAYVGMAPQQGGQVVEIDARTGAVRLTGGYCGQGPDDAFAAKTRSLRTVHCESALQRIHERRLARPQ